MTRWQHRDQQALFDVLTQPNAVHHSRRAVGTYLGGAGQNIGWLEAWQAADDATTHVFPVLLGGITGSSTALAVATARHSPPEAPGTPCALVWDVRRRWASRPAPSKSAGTVQPGGGTLQLEVDGTLVAPPAQQYDGWAGRDLLGA